MRIALLTYRGNMFCGGQGIYASYLAREWQRAGHDVHVIAGPPLPELDPGIPLHEIPNDNVFGRRYPDFFDPTRPFSLLQPLSLWELGVSRFGVFPEMQTFGLRLMMRWKELQRRHRFDVVFDNQCLSWGLLGIRATGMPVVSVIHHPLHIDREADFAIDARLSKKIKRTLYFPLFMQQQVAPRLDRIVTVSEASRTEIERYFGIPQKQIPVVYNGTDADLFHPHANVAKETDLLFIGRTEDRKKGIGTMLEALSLLPESITLKIVDGRIPDDGLVPQLLSRYEVAHRVKIVKEMLT
ncbi:MAG: glycosyltransferase family 4 protein, partial [Myxococcota bacterium]